MEKILKPEEIEKKSFEIIEEELASRGIVLNSDYEDIIKRVIHTTADFDFADNLFFSSDEPEKIMEAFLSAPDIVTDTNMTLSGISKPGLKKLGKKAFCYMADEDVVFEAKKLGITRAAVSVRKAVRNNPGCIYAVGNAPTALFELIDQIKSGFRPALVIAVPVGFVNVIEAKEAMKKACEEYEIPGIISFGNKGGSTVSAAIINAMIYRFYER